MVVFTFVYSRMKQARLDRESTLVSMQDMSSKRDAPFFNGCVDTNAYLQSSDYEKQNGAFIMLTRNEELDGVIKTMISLEKRFNQWFQYPYIFLNNQPFTEAFQQKINTLTKAKVTFALVEDNEWNFENEDSLSFHQYIEGQGDRGIMYGNMVSYHRMCRFYSGMFYKHPEVAKLEWYWRIEPDVEFFCDITYDPFYEMQIHNKKYGFTILIKELYWTVPNLFRATRSFIKENNLSLGSIWKVFVKDYGILKGDEYLDSFVNSADDVDREISREVLIEELTRKFEEQNMLDNELIEEVIHRNGRKVPVVEDKFDNEEYNLCHFWSNFEIARIDVFENKIYNAYFDYLQTWGGFWEERWGDAPVHSLGLALTLNLEDVHYFRDIGYQHSIIAHCPKNKLGKQLPYRVAEGYHEIFKNAENEKSNFEKWKGIFKSNQIDEEVNTGSGCRCQCPNVWEIEESSSGCLSNWFYLLSDEYKEEKPLSASDLKNQVLRDYRRKLKPNPE